MPSKDPEKIRASMRAYRLKNRDKVLEGKRKYRESNKEKIRKYMIKYRQDNKEALSIQKKGYRKINKERITECKKSNTALLLQHKANRRARKKRAIPAWLKDCSIEKRRVYTVYLLSRLLAKADGIERHVDHMWPLSDGGPHWSGNLQVLTATDNMAKAAYSCPKLKKQMKLNLKEAKVLYAKAA
jgi:hypothetical protein